MLESSNSLLALLNDVLDFSKIESGKVDLESIEFRLRQCVEESIRSFLYRAKQKSLTLSYEISPDTHDWFTGDPLRLRQVLVNLVSNAIKFTDEGAIRIRVQTVSTIGDTAVLRVRGEDTGIGIPADKRQKVFEEFEQADSSTKRRFGGTGLGLAICSRLVQLMQGEIGVDSEEGQGQHVPLYGHPRTAGHASPRQRNVRRRVGHCDGARSACGTRRRRISACGSCWPRTVR